MILASVKCEVRQSVVTETADRSHRRVPGMLLDAGPESQVSGLALYVRLSLAHKHLLVPVVGANLHFHLENRIRECIIASHHSHPISSTRIC